MKKIFCVVAAVATGALLEKNLGVVDKSVELGKLALSKVKGKLDEAKQKADFSDVVEGAEDII